MGVRRFGWILTGAIFASALVITLPACQSNNVSLVLSTKSSETPVSTVASIARLAQKCWFKTRDPAFAGLRLSSEVNSPSGKPRFLLVRRSNPNGLPQLVVQARERTNPAEGHATDIDTFGPMLQTASAERIVRDIRRWSEGKAECSA